MIRIIIFIFVSILVVDFAYAHEKASTRLPIDHLLKTYAENNGVQFVIDVRVKGFFEVVGLDLDQLTRTQLVDMLAVTGIVAIIKEDIVYVLPRGAYDLRGDELGDFWVD